MLDGLTALAGGMSLMELIQNARAQDIWRGMDACMTGLMMMKSC